MNYITYDEGVNLTLNWNYEKLLCVAFVEDDCDACDSFFELICPELEEMDITGVRANPNCGDEVISLIENNRIQVRPYITHSFPLREYQRAHDVFVAREDGALLVNLYPGT